MAVLALAITFPLMAEAITGTTLDETIIKANSEEIRKLQFKLNERVNKIPSPFGGYAIFTDGGAVIAYTSHAGFFDSVKQKGPTADQIANPIFGTIAAVCNPDTMGDACGGEWHSHLVLPNVGDTLCNTVGGIASISELTYNEPTKTLFVFWKSIIGTHIDIGTSGHVGALSGTLQPFTVGDPIEGGAQFDLVAVDGNGDPLTPDTIANFAGVCIVPSA